MKIAELENELAHLKQKVEKLEALKPWGSLNQLLSIDLMANPK